MENENINIEANETEVSSNSLSISISGASYLTRVNSMHCEAKGASDLSQVRWSLSGDRGYVNITPRTGVRVRLNYNTSKTPEPSNFSFTLAATLGSSRATKSIQYRTS